jgi:hypothetical protein
MALTQQLDVATGIGTTSTFPNAYIKVGRILGDKSLIDIRIDSYSEVNGWLVLERVYQFQPSLNDKNFIEQAYLYLKTLPEFADATDC